jgi:hypothetical protein
MAIFSFSGEIISEVTGDYFDFEFDYEEYLDSDTTPDEMVQMGLDFASFRDATVLNYIMDNLSVVLNFEGVQE